MTRPSLFNCIAANASTDPTLLSTADLARLLGCRPQTLRKWRLQGCGPQYVRLGGPSGRVVYRMSVVEAWLAARTFASTAAETVARA